MRRWKELRRFYDAYSRTKITLADLSYWPTILPSFTITDPYGPPCPLDAPSSLSSIARDMNRCFSSSEGMYDDIFGVMLRYLPTSGGPRKHDPTPNFQSNRTFWLLFEKWARAPPEPTPVHTYTQLFVCICKEDVTAVQSLFILINSSNTFSSRYSSFW